MENDCRFIIDTSTLIDLENNFPEDIFQSIHELCYNMFEEGKLFSVKAVFIELKDSSEKWKKYEDKFRELNNNETKKLGELLHEDKFQVFVNHGVKNNQGNGDWADPHLIACALENDNVIVVSNESSTNHPKRKIPYVCDECGITCVNFFDFLRMMEFKF